ncbi:MAG: hypothetical protein H7Z43_05790 [Clostridia bacterium]|nr:hypothetical protein [Deltaproteobacteria bacterium]
MGPFAQQVVAVICLMLVACNEAPDTTGRACGMSFAHSWTDNGARGYGSPSSYKALDELQTLGIQAISLHAFAFMNDIEDAIVSTEPRYPGAESFADLTAMADAAHSRGMTVMVKPQIWLVDGQWCGQIKPNNGWAPWFASYTTFILKYAALAESFKADWLTVGVELGSSTAEAGAFWPSVISKVRKVYHGKVLYAANWDEAEHVTFWPLVDAVGVQMYAPLRQEHEPATVSALAKGARRWLRKYESIADAAGKPLVITEAGYVNREGVTAAPHIWPSWVTGERQSKAGDDEQAAGYQALIETFGQSKKVERIYWWKWFTDVEGPPEEGALGFDPKGRRAESVIRFACDARMTSVSRPHGEQ